MYAQIGKSKENKRRVVANFVAQTKRNGKKGFRFVDNRSEKVTGKSLQMVINMSSPMNLQKKVIQKLNSISAKKASDQAVQEIDNTIGGSQLLSGWGNWTAGHGGHNFNQLTRNAVNAIGDVTGCCICATKDPGWNKCRTNASGKQVGNFTPDHEPPNTLAGGGYTGNIRFYPHCKTHTNMQAAVVSSYKSRMKNIRKGTNSDWATGVQGSWFWN